MTLKSGTIVEYDDALKNVFSGPIRDQLDRCGIFPMVVEYVSRGLSPLETKTGWKIWLIKKLGGVSWSRWYDTQMACWLEIKRLEDELRAERTGIPANQIEIPKRIQARNGGTS